MAPLLWSSDKIWTMARCQNHSVSSFVRLLLEMFVLSIFEVVLLFYHLKVQPRSSDPSPEHGWEVLERGVGGGDAQHGGGRYR